MAQKIQKTNVCRLLDAAGIAYELQKIQKTNVCRLLDAAGIAYELIEYAVDESDLSATHVAEQLGEDVDAVFKTIVLEGDKVKHFVCVVPGACEVDLKKAARASGNKSCGTRRSCIPR